MEELINLVQTNIENNQLELATGDNPDKATKIDKKAFIEKNKVQLKIQKTAKFLQELNWEEKFEWVHQKKLKGNRLIKKKKIKEAQDLYFEALIGLELKNGTKEQNERVKNELQIPLLMNLGACFLKTKEYERAIQLYNKGLELNPNNYKLISKRGYAFSGLRDYSKAKDDYRRAIALCNDEEEINLIKECLAQLNFNKEKEAAPYKKFFGTEINNNNNDTEKETENKSTDNEEVLSYNDEWEEMEKLKLLRWVYYPTKKTFSLFKSKLFSCCRRDYSFEE